MVKFTTNHGVLTAELFADKAPKTVENFLNYVNAGFYNGTLLHSVLTDWIVECGVLGLDGLPKPTNAPIKNEAANGLSNKRGTLAMAHEDFKPHSATAGFFINMADNLELDFKSPTKKCYGYCVFGEITSGMSVLDSLKNVPKQTLKFRDTNILYKGVPIEPVILEKVEII